MLHLSLVPTCPKNRKNRGFLQSSDVWDSYEQCEHPIPDIPDGRPFLRRDRKNRKHFYFEGTVPDGLRRWRFFMMSVNIKFACLGQSPTVGDFYDECEHEICLSGTSGMLDFVYTCNQSLIFIELSMYNFEYCSQKLSTNKRFCGADSRITFVRVSHHHVLHWKKLCLAALNSKVIYLVKLSVLSTTSLPVHLTARGFRK